MFIGVTPKLLDSVIFSDLSHNRMVYDLAMVIVIIMITFQEAIILAHLCVYCDIA